VAKLLIIYLGFALVLVLQGCYAVKQAYVQGTLLLSAVEVSDYVNAQDADNVIIEKLNDLDEIIVFAETQKIFADGSYKEIVFPENGKVSFLAISAPYNSLKPTTYWFPFVGNVPYKGFFSESDRDDFIDELKGNGFDTYKSEAGAFSLLGYLDDPIFPSMLLRSRASMAHLFFHELTHKTVWIQNRPKFNERLAEFVAEKTTTSYLKENGYIKALSKYKYRGIGRKHFNIWFTELKKTLAQLYEKNLNKDEIISIKEKVIKNATNKKPTFEAYDYVGKNSWNNARIAITNTYGTDYRDFEDAYSCFLKRPYADKLMGDFLIEVKNRSEDIDDNDELLQSFCEDEDEE
jgi:predicted aminopeptidase